MKRIARGRKTNSREYEGYSRGQVMGGGGKGRESCSLVCHQALVPRMADVSIFNKLVSQCVLWSCTTAACLFVAFCEYNKQTGE